MGYKAVTVSTRSALNNFLNLPFKIYKDDKNWVAPVKSEIKRILHPKRNPYFKNATIALFNCYYGNDIRSRVSVVINKIFCEKAKKNIAFFGFFESYNEPDAVKYLFCEVFKYCSYRKIEKLEGPFNPNHYSELGMLYNRFNASPSFFQTYNPDYYNSLLKNLGFEIEKVIHTRRSTNSSEHLVEKFGNKINLSLPGLSVRSFNLRNFKNDLECLRKIFNDAFSENWHFVPVSREEYLFSSKYMKFVTPPSLIQFVEYEGNPVAAIHFVLDINPALKILKGNAGIFKYLKLTNQIKKIDSAIIFAVGVKKSFRNSKVTQLLFNAAVNTAERFDTLETTWMYDDNKIVNSLAERLGLKKDKEFVIYSKNLIN
ncbi:MAG TPA: hypothetical protein VMT35_13460 [Ignavibacteriaceae bacterium]|nr:hypothetical protein [Ignavibacteriaceae bacterium]